MTTSVEMMEAQSEWPLWPVLPLKRWRGGKFLEVGFMTAYHGCRVFLGNMHESTAYAGYHEIVADGWEVD